MTNQTAWLEFARQIAIAAAADIMPHYRHDTVQIKSDGTEVTIADQAAEAKMRSLITAKYPDHSIWDEEFGKQYTTNSRYCWVLDPIDGTTWFTLGIPLFGTLVALLEDGDPVVGVIHFPALHKTTFAAKGSGCWFQADTHEPIQVQVSQQKRVQQAFLSST